LAIILIAALGFAVSTAWAAGCPPTAQHKKQGR
jgi:hypothetical protein